MADFETIANFSRMARIIVTIIFLEISLSVVLMQGTCRLNNKQQIKRLSKAGSIYTKVNWLDLKPRTEQGPQLPSKLQIQEASFAEFNKHAIHPAKIDFEGNLSAKTGKVQKQYQIIQDMCAEPSSLQVNEVVWADLKNDPYGQGTRLQIRDADDADFCTNERVEASRSQNIYSDDVEIRKSSNIDERISSIQNDDKTELNDLSRQNNFESQSVKVMNANEIDENHSYSDVNESSYDEMYTSFYNELQDTVDWLSNVKAVSIIHIPDNAMTFLDKWNQCLLLISQDDRSVFRNLQTLSINSSLRGMSLTNAFVNSFWPFDYNISRFNQLLGLTALSSTFQEGATKVAFFQQLFSHQMIEIPVEEHKVVYSFDDTALVNGLNRTGLVHFSERYVAAGNHIFSSEEREKIVKNVDEAFRLIQHVSPDLHNAIVQLVGCIAFYKAEVKGYMGGTISSALGVIWMDPSAGKEWVVPFYAEQIVHEFIHTSLFYAELVHGTYTDYTNLRKAQVKSSIRRQLRDYDKSFHAAYVSTGLVTFHTRAGYIKRAAQLAMTLRSSVDDLQKVNTETQILNESGTAMLQFLADMLEMTRIKRME